jgi:hypothetical protein
MNNKDLAIQWAKAAVLQDKLVYSDKFFDPFNDNMRMVIIRHLAKQGIVAWWDTKNGAFIFKEDDPRAHIVDFKDETGYYFGGTYTSGTDDAPFITILPILQAQE